MRILGKNRFLWKTDWCIGNYEKGIFRTIKGQKPELLLGDFKRFTSKAIIKAITENPKESRKEWLLEQFMKAGAKSSNVKQYQFWRHDNKPIELSSNKVIDEKINYVHNNPVERDYAGEKGLIDGLIVVT